MYNVLFIYEKQKFQMLEQQLLDYIATDFKHPKFQESYARLRAFLGTKKELDGFVCTTEQHNDKDSLLSIPTSFLIHCMRATAYSRDSQKMILIQNKYVTPQIEYFGEDYALPLCDSKSNARV